MEPVLLLVAIPAIIAVPLLGRPALLGVLVCARSISDIGAGTLGTILPSGMLSSLIGAVIIVVSVWPGGGRKLSKRVSLGLVLFGIVLLLGVVVSGFSFGFQSSNIAEAIRWTSIAAVFVYAFRFIDRRPRCLGKLLMWITLPSLIVGALGFAFQSQLFVNVEGRLSGTFSHPNAAGAFFGVATVVFFSLALASPSRALWLMFVLSLAVCVTTLSLGSLISVTASVLVVLLVSSRRTGVFKALSVCGVVIASMFLLALPIFGERLASFQGDSATGDANSLEWRYLNWEMLLSEWRKSPLFGFGVGTSTEQIMPLGGPPHSAPIQLLVEFGLIGLALATFGLLRMVILGTRLNRRRRWQGGVYISLIIFMIVNGAESNLIGYTAAMYLLALVVGALAASSPNLLHGPSTRESRSPRP